MKILGVITAREGSKRLVGKNKLPLGGKALYEWAVDEALKSDLTDVVVSTDDTSILVECGSWGNRELYLIDRPAWLCQDRTPHLPVIRHAVEIMKLKHNKNYAAVMTLHPTSPFRTAEHINEAIKIFERDERDSLTSVDVDNKRNAAIYITSTARLFSKYGYIIPENENYARIVMDRKSSLDINTLADFNKAKELYEET